MDQQVNIAIIGGTGLYELEGLNVIEEFYPDTPWGKPSDKIIIAKFNEKPVAFLPRHGRGHHISPSEIPVRANIAALKFLGVEEIVSFSAVGSLREEIEPTDFVVPDQIIDRTKGIRPSTFFENGVVAHAMFGLPFSESLSQRVLHAAQKIHLKMHENRTLICMEGPIFSTRAESRMYRSLGGDIINMSVLPEAKLAREAEIAYQMVCMATDYDSWMVHEEPVTVETVLSYIQKNSENAKKLLYELLPNLGNGDDVSLKGSMKYAIVTDPAKQNPETVRKLKMLHPEYF